MILTKITRRAVFGPARHAKQPFGSGYRHFSFEPVVDVLQDGASFLQLIRVETGIPWWGLIPLVTISVRTLVTLPLAVYQRKGLQKQNELRPIVNAISPILKVKLAANAQTEQLKRIRNPNAAAPVKTETEQLTADKIIVLASKEKMKRQKKIFKKNGCQTWKFMVLPALQIPLWISMSYIFRILTGWSNVGTKPIDPSLTTDGIGHLHDLALSDPYFVLPVILGITALTNAEWNFKTADLMKLTTRGVRNALRPTAFDTVINLSRASIAFLVVFSTQAPAALSIYWISSNFYSLVQNLVLDKLLPLRYTPYSRFTTKASKVPKDAVPLIKY